MHSVADILVSRTFICYVGLGDSNYSNFCNMGKLLDERMSVLGATRFYEPGFADDAVG